MPPGDGAAAGGGAGGADGGGFEPGRAGWEERVARYAMRPQGDAAASMVAEQVVGREPCAVGLRGS